MAPFIMKTLNSSGTLPLQHASQLTHVCIVAADFSHILVSCLKPLYWHSALRILIDRQSVRNISVVGLPLNGCNRPPGDTVQSLARSLR